MSPFRGSGGRLGRQPERMTAAHMRRPCFSSSRPVCPQWRHQWGAPPPPLPGPRRRWPRGRSLPPRPPTQSAHTSRRSPTRTVRNACPVRAGDFFVAQTLPATCPSNTNTHLPQAPLQTGAFLIDAKGGRYGGSGGTPGRPAPPAPAPRPAGRPGTSVSAAVWGAQAARRPMEATGSQVMTSVRPRHSRVISKSRPGRPSESRTHWPLFPHKR